jgi:hypothetical protein
MLRPEKLTPTELADEVLEAPILIGPYVPETYNGDGGVALGRSFGLVRSEGCTNQPAAKS